MSYSIFYHSFNADIADKNWRDFDVCMQRVLKNYNKIEELEKKRSGLSEYDLSEEEIYNPKLKDRAERKRAEIIRMKHDINQKLQSLRNLSPASRASIFYYIKRQVPIESDIVIQVMVDLDLAFGGKSTSFSSLSDPITQIAITLMILFPELNQKNEELNKEDFVILLKYLHDFDARFETHKKELLESKEFDISNDNDLEQLRVEMKEYLLTLLPVAKEVASGAQFFDSDGVPDDTLLEDRARKHIEELKNHPLMKIPLKNYRK